MLHWTELALRKTGCGDRTQFQKRFGLPVSGQWDLPTCRGLWPWLPGYALHRVQPGERLYQIAQRYDSQVQDIRAANRGCADRVLPGQLLQVPLPCAVVPWETDFGSQLQEIFLDGLQARYPELESEILARTAGGRPVRALRLGHGRRRVLLTAAHHANEWITGLLLWRLLEDYCRAIHTGGALFGFSAGMLLRQTTLHLVPLVNPDGVDLVTGEIPKNSPEYAAAEALAAARPELPFPAGWKANLQGVDLNLSYPARWELAREGKTPCPGPRDYPGTAPLCQPEAQALADYTRRVAPDCAAAWHTQGGEIYAAAPDGSLPDGDMARRLARASGYRLAQVPAESANAGYRDWFLQEFHRPAYTIEAGRGENPLPVGDLRRLYEENLPIFALLLHG